jgi:hypothetical protein
MPVSRRYSSLPNKLRHKFRNAGLEKQGFLDVIREKTDAGRFIDPSQLEQELNSYFSVRGIRLSKRKVSELFQHFQLSPESLVDLPQVADCLFSENYADFIDRHNRNPRLVVSTEVKQSQKENEKSNDRADDLAQSILPIIRQFEAKTLLKNKGIFDTFKAVDIDKDGYLSKQDFRNFMKHKTNITEKDIDSLFDFFNKDKNGSIPLSCFAERMHSTDPLHKLAENDRTTNIMGLRQFDPRRYLKEIGNHRSSIEDARGKFRISSSNDNCMVTSLFREE